MFRLFGFAPIDTPVLEYAEVLLGKGGGETDKQVYRFTDHGGRDVALRYDLTVPFARFMAAHLAELPLPFKRWHAAKVWRGENTQRGRYREFIQVDFDIVGADSAAADLEILLLMRESFAALGTSAVHDPLRPPGRVQRVPRPHRGRGERGGDPARHRQGAQDRPGEDPGAARRRSPAGRTPIACSTSRASRAASPRPSSSCAEAAGPECEGVQRLAEIGRGLEELGDAGSFVLDPSITRGLDYYTGIVFETFLTELPDIGSVCSGGRYNDLASLYTKQSLPGCRRLDRARPADGRARRSWGSPLPGPGCGAVLVVLLDEGLLGGYQRIAAAFRAAGIPAEVYPEKKKLAVQFAWAEKKGIPLAVLFGEEESGAGPGRPEGPAQPGEPSTGSPSKAR